MMWRNGPFIISICTGSNQVKEKGWKRGNGKWYEYTIIILANPN